MARLNPASIGPSQNASSSAWSSFSGLRIRGVHGSMKASFHSDRRLPVPPTLSGAIWGILVQRF